MLCLQRYSDRPTLKIREQFPTEHASLKCVLGPMLLIDSRVLINTIKLEKYSLDETEKNVHWRYNLQIGADFPVITVNKL